MDGMIQYHKDIFLPKYTCNFTSIAIKTKQVFSWGLGTI